MTSYHSVDYWDTRYSEDTQPFEWYQPYSGIRHFLTPKYLSKSSVNVDGKQWSDRVLIVGCGTSELGQDMFKEGFRHITNVDFSSVLIAQLKKKYTDHWYREMQKRLPNEKPAAATTASPKPKSNRTRLSNHSPAKQPSKTPIKNRMEFHCHDITKRLEFADKSFDLIVCKGTLDAVLCNQNAHEKVEAMMTECQRVLDAHGAMVVISYGAPDDRMDCFDNTLWKEIKSYTAPKPYVPGMTDIR